MNRENLKDIKRWVVKIGSSMITKAGEGLDYQRLDDWAGQIAQLQKQGKEFVLVSSGAVATGLKVLNWQTKPTELDELQTAAAVGQISLARAWQNAFEKYGITIAQILLTHDDAADRRRYLNVKSALNKMCELNIIPFINENDTVSFDEIKFGDNDNLGAMVANVVSAGAYIILTDQKGMYNKNPREFSDAQFLEKVEVFNPDLLKMAGKVGGVLGSGGMHTKVLAAQKAARSGTQTLLAYGYETEVIKRLSEGENLGTWFVAPQDSQSSKKQWLAGQVQVLGKLFLDEGAEKALKIQGSSLLPIGVKKIEGEFQRGSLVACISPKGEEIAHGLINYDSEDCLIFLGKKTSEIKRLLLHGETLIHRDNLVLMGN